jgi:putative transposase
LYGGIAKYMGKIFHELAGQRDRRILEGHVCPDHVYMLIEIPPKYAVSAVVGYIKGKSAIARTNGKTSPGRTSGQEAISYQP